MKSRSRAFATCLVAICLGAGLLATSASAAAPAWQPVATSGPTHLPPVQSEVQRLGVDATGGTYELTATTATGSGTLNVISGLGIYGSGVTTIDVCQTSAGTFADGQAISGPGIPAGTTIAAPPGPPVPCPPAPDLPMFSLVISAPTTAGTFGETVTARSKEVSDVATDSGAFAAGQAISGTGIPADTTIDAVGAGTLTLSNFPTQGGTPDLTATETTGPIAFDATAAELEADLNAQPTLDVMVKGGPGGPNATDPYFVTFGGPLADSDVEKMTADASGLTGSGRSVSVLTTVPGGPGTGTIAIYSQNVGGQATSTATATLEAVLPPGVTLAGPPESQGYSGQGDWTCSGAGGDQSFACTFSESVPSGALAPTVTAPVVSEPGAADGAVEISVSGGGTAGPGSFSLPLTISSTPAGSGVQTVAAASYDENGVPEARAGAHPYMASTAFFINTRRNHFGNVVPVGEPKDFVVDLPPGFLGNPTATPRCPRGNVGSREPGVAICPSDTIVGRAAPLIVGFGRHAGDFPIYNLEPPFGSPGDFYFNAANTPIHTTGDLRSDDDYGITVASLNTQQIATLYGSFFTFWGTPADPSHDIQRCETEDLSSPPICSPPQPSTAQPPKALLSNPTHCPATGGPPVVRFSMSSWQSPSVFDRTSIEQPDVTGCDQLDFDADLDARPTTNVADSPTGLDVDLTIPQDGTIDPNGLASAHLRHTTVQLPEGIAINPSGANGLDGCSPEEIGLLGTEFEGPHPVRFDKQPAECPDASKVGVVEVDTPLLGHPLPGTVYTADPFDNPFDSLLVIYLEINDPRSGTVAKLAGSVDLDPATGRITSTFANNPQLPFSQFRIDFKSGAHAPLSTPPACGTYQTRSTLTPWSAPDSGPPVTSIDAYQITQGPSGACAGSPAALPHSPNINAGSSSAIAGQYSPFILNLSRADGTQRFKDVTVTPPAGLTAKLAGIPYCSDAALAAAGNRDGRAEQASPSCPAASKLGDVFARAGTGPDPYTAPGAAYLSGPYKGAPLSLAILTPAVAGPFDLGVVVIRTALHVNPVTAEITAVSDPLPEILDGIPLNIRSASVRINRSEFTKNPTSCEPGTVKGSLTSTLGAVAALSERFQVGECARLGFKPRLGLRLRGGTRRGAHPQLTAFLLPRAGDANIRSVSVAFPRSEFLENAHIRTICTRPDFAADNCPKGAVYGTSTVITPLLDYPLTGNVYLRSSDNLLPDLVTDLRGPASQPIKLETAGRTDSVRGGIRTTIDFVPDAPFTKALVRLQGGNKGLLVNSRDICKRAYRATVRFRAHNGRAHVVRPKLVAVNCKKKRKAKRGGHKRTKRGAKRLALSARASVSVR